MRIAVLLITLCSLAPRPAVAQADCDAIMTLSDMQAAMERIAAPGHSRIDYDMRQIRSATLRIDAASIRFALRDHPLATYDDSIRRFLTIAQVAGETWYRGERAFALRFAQRPDVVEAVRTLGRILPRHSCDIAQTTNEITHTSPRTFQATEVTRELPKPPTLIALLVLSLLLAALCIYLIKRQLRRIAEQKRRSRRYYVDLPARLFAPDTKSGDAVPTAHSVRIVDISCNGAKVRHSLNAAIFQARSIVVGFESKRLVATPVWHNAHFAGLKFQAPLKQALVRSLSKSHKRQAREQSPAKPLTSEERSIRP